MHGIGGRHRRPGRPRIYDNEHERQEVNRAAARLRYKNKRDQVRRNRILEGTPPSLRPRVNSWVSDLGGPTQANIEPPRAVTMERARAYADDPRDLVGQLMGDPMPGRSALDKKRLRVVPA